MECSRNVNKGRGTWLVCC